VVLKDQIVISYHDGRTLLVAREYVEMHGHTLAEKVLLNFLPFTKLTEQATGKKAADNLIIAIADKVIINASHFIPADVVDAYRELLDFE
jgi:hypothetical protein